MRFEITEEFPLTLTAEVASSGLPAQSVKGAPPAMMLFEIVEEAAVTPPLIELFVIIDELSTVSAIV